MADLEAHCLDLCRVCADLVDLVANPAWGDREWAWWHMIAGVACGANMLKMHA